MKKKYILPLFWARAILLVGNAAVYASTTFYGYIKLDAPYDDARADKGNYAFVVLDEPKDDEFNMTTNQSRIGLKLDGPNSENMKISGTVEVDFFGVEYVRMETKYKEGGTFKNDREQISFLYHF